LSRSAQGWYRYVEQHPLQALVLKLARVVSGLHAAQLLLNYGFVQELATLQRTFDEFNEDISFLAFGMQSDPLPDLHQKYLSAFWQEEFDKPEDPMRSTQNRWSAPRKKVTGFLGAIHGPNGDPSTHQAAATTVNKAYSGYVHAAAPQVLDMYGGSPPKFHIDGLLGTSRIAAHASDLVNYYYRGLLSFGISAKSFGDESLYDAIK
jgi:hypothetical protein